MKRIVLFLITNLAVVLVLSLVLRLFGLDRVVQANGINVGSLLVFSFVVGFAGSIISLLMSKSMAKWSTGAQVIDTPRNEAEAWIVDTIRKLAQQAGVAMPEVAIYEGAPNAFATGAFKNSALVAVSSGLLQSMNKEEVEAVLGHELSHVANGDMVTLALIQGVVNTFVIFFARVAGDSHLQLKLVLIIQLGLNADHVQPRRHHLLQIAEDLGPGERFSRNKIVQEF